jgi:hypothetical protein
VLYNLFVSLALIFNQYANPIALSAIKWKCKRSPTSRVVHELTDVDYIVYDVWIFIELLVVYFLFVETSGSSLEEIAAIIDGEEVRDTIIKAVVCVTDSKMVDDGSYNEKRAGVTIA